MSKILISPIYNKKGKVYQYRFEIIQDGAKRRWVSKSGFKTASEARSAGKQAKREYEQQGIPLKKKQRISLSGLLDIWFEKEAELTYKESTVLNYRKYVRLYIEPALGKYLASSIDRQNIKEFLNDMYNAGYSKTTIDGCKGVLSKCFDYAAENHYIASSPMIGLKSPHKGGRPPSQPTRSKPHIYVTAEDMALILKRFPEGTPAHIALQLGYHCGLRIAETFALTWEDIDFEKRTIEINRQIQWCPDKNRTDKKEKNGTSEAGDGYWYFSGPKYGSYRIIEMDQEILDILKHEKERQDKAKPYYGDRYIYYYSSLPLYHSGKEPVTAQSN